METVIATGIVKWFNRQRDIGFIRPSGGGGRGVFDHISAVGRASLNPLDEAHTVGCEIASNRGKEPAVNLKAKPPFVLNQQSLPPQNVDARIGGERALQPMLEELDARPSQIPSVPVQVRRRER